MTRSEFVPIKFRRFHVSGLISIKDVYGISAELYVY